MANDEVVGRVKSKSVRLLNTGHMLGVIISDAPFPPVINGIPFQLGPVQGVAMFGGNNHMIVYGPEDTPEFQKELSEYTQMMEDPKFHLFKKTIYDLLMLGKSDEITNHFGPDKLEYAWDPNLKRLFMWFGSELIEKIHSEN